MSAQQPQQTKYGFSKTVDLPFGEAVEKTRAALKEEGFGVLTEIDIKEKLKEKLGVDFRRYIILGACNPVLANQALQVDPDIGLLLPCNVVVREEEDGSIIVGFMDPAAVLKLVERDDIATLAGEVRRRLERVRDALLG